VVIGVIYLLVGLEVWRRGRLLTDLNSSESHQVGLTSAAPTDQTKGAAEDEQRINRWRSNDKRRSFDITVSYTPTTDSVAKSPQDAYSVNVSAASGKPSFSAPKSGPKVFKKSTLRTYIRTAFLFWVIFVITWIPSSANRVYSLAHSKGSPSFTLSMLSCITLPLQGFWNAIVFTVVGARGWRASRR
jgi:hypothetical protein